MSREVGFGVFESGVASRSTRLEEVDLGMSEAVRLVDLLDGSLDQILPPLRCSLDLALEDFSSCLPSNRTSRVATENVSGAALGLVVDLVFTAALHGLEATQTMRWRLPPVHLGSLAIGVRIMAVAEIQLFRVWQTPGIPPAHDGLVDEDLDHLALLARKLASEIPVASRMRLIHAGLVTRLDLEGLILAVPVLSASRFADLKARIRRELAGAIASATAWLGDQPTLRGAQARIIMERLAGHLWVADERREWLGAWLLTGI